MKSFVALRPTSETPSDYLTDVPRSGGAFNPLGKVYGNYPFEDFDVAQERNTGRGGTGKYERKPRGEYRKKAKEV